MIGKNGFAAPLILLIVALALVAGVYLAGKTQFFRLSPANPPPSSESSPSATSADCAQTSIPDYEPATHRFLSSSSDATETAEFSLDFKGNGQKELVKVYQEALPPGQYGGRSKPVILAVFSGDIACPKEEFKYVIRDNTGTGWAANEWGAVQSYPNFFGNGKDVLFFQPISTGYGSGYSSALDFLTYQDGGYKIVVIPTLAELSVYKFDGTDYKGHEILVATAIWSEDEAHFSPHPFQFLRYAWNGSGYTKTELGKTKNKYDILEPNPVTIDTIIQNEPNVLTP